MGMYQIALEENVKWKKIINEKFNKIKSGNFSRIPQKKEKSYQKDMGGNFFFARKTSKSDLLLEACSL